MARHTTGDQTGVAAVANARLFRALAEDLRLPLVQIARSSELSTIDTDTAVAERIEATADAALKLIDSYVLSTQVLFGQQQLELEPVSASAILYDTAQYMSSVAKVYDVEMTVEASSRGGLIMAHPKALQAALISLTYAFISSMPRVSAEKPAKIMLRAQKNGRAVVTGVMVQGKKISAQSLNAARQTYGTLRQPLATHAHTNAAGIYVADSLFAAMASELQARSARGASGLVANLYPSHQLTLL